MEQQLKFVADEGVEKAIVLLLRKTYDVLYAAEFMQSAPDTVVLQAAMQKERILITLDKDFGELVFHHNQQHFGVILCRVQSLPIDEAAELVRSTIDKYGIELKSSFTVIQPNNIRVRNNNQ